MNRRRLMVQVLAVISRRTPAFQEMSGQPVSFAGKITRAFSWLMRRKSRIDFYEHRLLLAMDSSHYLSVDSETRLADRVAPLIAAVGSYDNVVIRVGSLLVVKVDSAVFVVHLTVSKQRVIDRSPQLLSSPRGILDALREDLNEQEAQRAEALLVSIGDVDRQLTVVAGPAAGSSGHGAPLPKEWRGSRSGRKLPSKGTEKTSRQLPADFVDRVVDYYRIEAGRRDFSSGFDVVKDIYRSLAPIVAASPVAFVRLVAEAVLPIGGEAVRGGTQLVRDLVGVAELADNPDYLAMVDASVLWLREQGVSPVELTGYERAYWQELHGNETW